VFADTKPVAAGVRVREGLGHRGGAEPAGYGAQKGRG
jgi:hypothetical protein